MGDCGRNALHWAIHINNIDLVSFLLIKGASLTKVTIDQYSPLQLAVQHHSSAIVSLLLEQPNFNVNQVTKHGTALHLAVRN
jgi:ankyrin repeat protein